MVCKINSSESQWACSLQNSKNVFADKKSTPSVLGIEEESLKQI